MTKPPTANEDDLAKHFAKFGLVDHVSVAKDKNGGDGHKGFAFITFQDKQVSRAKKSHFLCQAKNFKTLPGTEKMPQVKNFEKFLPLEGFYFR